MLHHIELPTYDGKLDHIVEFQRKFIVFLCSSSIPLTPQKADFKEAFTDEQSREWLWNWLQRKKKKGNGTYYNDLCRLLTHLDSHPEERQQIIDAFKNDTDFYACLKDEQFQFLFNTRFRAQKYTILRQALASVMIVFYDVLFFEGFPSCIASIDRKDFLRIFWSTNKDLEVCPACDGQLPDIHGQYPACDLDHFFPKALYPFLAISASNLVPLCLDCNRVFKHGKDPLDHSLTAPLLQTFHPYGRPAIDEINVVVTRRDNGERTILLEERTGGTSKRIEQLNHIFELESRWNGRLKQKIGSIERKIQRAAEIWIKKGRTATEIVEDLLETEIGNKDIGKTPNGVIIRGYIEYVKHNTDERLTLERQISSDD